MIRIYNAAMNDKYVELLRGRVKFYWDKIILQLPKIVKDHKNPNKLLKYYKQQSENRDLLVNIFNNEDAKEDFILRSPNLTVENYEKQLAQLKIASHHVHRNVSQKMQTLVDRVTLDEIYGLYYPEHLDFINVYQQWRENLNTIKKVLSVSVYTGMLVKEVFMNPIDKQLKN
jgi:hypothetical protein